MPAGRALAAGGGTDPRLAIQGLGEDARQGGLADAPGPGKEIGVMEAILIEGIAQRPHHMGLTDHVREGAGSPLAGQYLIGHAVMDGSLGVER